MNKEIRIVGFIMAILLVLLCVLMNEATNVLRENNRIERQDQTDSLRQEYERVLLGCHTSGAVASEDYWLRELCDERLPMMRSELFLE